jgi:uncharacterized protein
MESFLPFIIKSFKHDGHLHRMWLENWLVPQELLVPEHRQQSMMVLINSQTKIQEADGKEWTSRIPGVSFFIPKLWFNIVALIEDNGVRYYCNIASPPYVSGGSVITYIDYDLDVILLPDGTVHVVDEDEYERHKSMYHYSPAVEEKVKQGLEDLLGIVHRKGAPFEDEHVLKYFRLWEEWRRGGPA